MSITAEGRGQGLRTARERVRNVARLVFGDDVGLLLFLGTVAVSALHWRLGIFITDNATLGNALAALADGHLAIDQVRYGSPNSPGTHEVGGRLYGRNYGQVVASLPALAVLRGLTAFGQLRVVLAAGWSLLLLATVARLGALLGYRVYGVYAGSLAALVAFVANVAVATPVPAGQLPILALQLTSMAATGLVAVLAYRLFRRMHGYRVGVAAGVGAVFATPVGFWATVPKRHVVTTAVVLGVVYAFYRSREGDTAGSLVSPTGFRALAYALVGYLTWVHAAEGLVLLCALAVVDIPTAPENSPRALATVAAAFLLSLLPFFLTNAAVVGNPVEPPRLWPVPDGGSRGLTGGASSGGSGSSGGGSSLLPPAFREPITDLLTVPTTLLSLFAASVDVLVSDPGRAYRTFVRGGYIPSIADMDEQAIYLTMLESAPVLAALTAGVGAAASAFRTPLSEAAVALRSSARATDAFVAAFAVLYTLLYLSRLPIHAQVTVRYLLPAFPLVLYGVLRQPSVRRLVDDRTASLGYAYAGGVLLGGQLLFLAVFALRLSRGEAFQLHALLGLGAAGVLAVAALAGGFDRRADRLTAPVLGLAAALATDFVLLAGVVYFPVPEHVLPVVRRFATLAGVG